MGSDRFPHQIKATNSNTQNAEKFLSPINLDLETSTPFRCPTAPLFSSKIKNLVFFSTSSGWNYGRINLALIWWASDNVRPFLQIKVQMSGAKSFTGISHFVTQPTLFPSRCFFTCLLTTVCGNFAFPRSKVIAQKDFCIEMQSASWSFTHREPDLQHHTPSEVATPLCFEYFVKGGRVFKANWLLPTF